jgi:Fungal specific transcription factor domain
MYDDDQTTSPPLPNSHSPLLQQPMNDMNGTLDLQVPPLSTATSNPQLLVPQTTSGFSPNGIPIDPLLSMDPFKNGISPPSADQFLSFTQDFDYGFGSWEAFAAQSEDTSPDRFLFGWDWTRTEELENLARNETMPRNTPVPDLPGPHVELSEQLPNPEAPNGTMQEATTQEAPDRDHPLRGAYEESPYFWRPAPNDNIQHTNSMSNLLTLVEAAKEQSPLSHPSRIPPLTTADRDRVLCLLYQCQSQLRGIYKEHDTPIFPSTVVFDWFIALYFQHFHPQNPFIHVSTFDPHGVEAVLLLAIITAGGFFAPQREVRGFAYGLAEMLRRCLTTHFESDNSRTRELQSLQAHHISLMLSCWSGNRRGMELAEAMRSTILSMFRRGGMFAKSGYRNPPVLRVEDSENSWIRYIQEEGRKRLVYFHVMMECQMGLFYDVSACLSYAELSLPLLFSEELWQCNSPEQWSTRWNHEIAIGILTPPSPQPGFTEYLRKFLTTSQPVSTSPTGGNSLSHYFILLSLQILIWEFAQSQKVMEIESDDTPDPFTNTSLTASRRQELEMLLKIWEKTHEYSPVDVDVGVEIFYHLVSLNLFANLDSIRLFTGREDHIGGRRVYPILLRWKMSNGSRRALWHAGQVIRVVRDRARAGMTNRVLWAPAAIHQACLVLWTYGVLSALRQEKLRKRSGTQPTHELPIRLDATDPTDADLKAFVEFGEGEPCLTRFDGSVSLDEPEGVAFECAGLLKGGFGDGGMLGENIAKILRTLGERTEQFKRWLKKNAGE